MTQTTETIDRLFLELSHFTQAKTARELALERQLAEAQRDASHLWNALKDLSFDCDGVTQTQAPNRGTYNSTFLVCKALEGKYGEAEHYEIRTPNMPAVNRYAAIDAAIQEQKK